jgi:biopolymer transport protein TolR
MGRRTSLVSLGSISEINMTPLMDLTFILLITFIITFPLIEQHVAINLPKGKANEMPQDVEARNISLSLDGKLFLDNEELSHDALAAALLDLGRSQPKTTVYIRADRALSYGDVVDVMKLLHAANLSRMALVTEGE